MAIDSNWDEGMTADKFWVIERKSGDRRYLVSGYGHYATPGLYTTKGRALAASRGLGNAICVRLIQVEE